MITGHSIGFYNACEILGSFSGVCSGVNLSTAPRKRGASFVRVNEWVLGIFAFL